VGGLTADAADNVDAELSVAKALLILKVVADVVDAEVKSAELFLTLSAVEVTTEAAETAASPDCVIPCIT
jgi:hypothetical protein